ncbi:MAG: hypothetical protein AB7Q45_27395, partial [Planctomycetaceae bacterium]
MRSIDRQIPRIDARVPEMAALFRVLGPNPVVRHRIVKLARAFRFDAADRSVATGGVRRTCPSELFFPIGGRHRVAASHGSWVP